MSFPDQRDEAEYRHGMSEQCILARLLNRNARWERFPVGKETCNVSNHAQCLDTRHGMSEQCMLAKLLNRNARRKKIPVWEKDMPCLIKSNVALVGFIY